MGDRADELADRIAAKADAIRVDERQLAMFPDAKILGIKKPAAKAEWAHGPDGKPAEILEAGFSASLGPDEHRGCCDYAYGNGLDDTGKGPPPCATCGTKHTLMHCVRLRKDHWRIVCRDCLPEGDPRRRMT